jgi:hypothetical protein
MLRERHLATPDAVATVALPVLSTGLVLGRDNQRALVTVRLFRPEPTRAVLVGGAWAAGLVAGRALAVGARMVAACDVGLWQRRGETLTRRPDRVTVLGVGPVPVGEPGRPVLVIDDAGAPGPEPGPWQTRLTLLSELTEADARILPGADLVLMQRLTEPEALAATRALRLPPEVAGHLGRLTDDMIAVSGGDADGYAWLSVTPTEQAHLGPPQRT